MRAYTGIAVPYTRKQAREIREKHAKVLAELQDVYEDLILVTARRLTQGRARDYLSQGVCRRLSLIMLCARNIFRIFPPGRRKLLERDALRNLEINLHAFVINVYGVQDNLAWVYVIEKTLESVIPGGRRNVGLFKRQTQEHFPTDVRKYFAGEAICTWHEKYAKDYRDALAHRIPLYVPPMYMTEQDAQRYQELESRIFSAIRAQAFDEVERLRAEQKAIGTVCDAFAHAVSGEERSRHMRLHPQVVADLMTVTEMVKTFFRNAPWAAGAMAGR